MQRLLFDQNLSPRLVTLLADLYHDAAHVALLGLGSASDKAVWEFSRDHDCIIVSKDADFSEMVVLHGFPPKVLWIQRGNCSTKDIENLLREHFDAIQFFMDDVNTGMLALL
jgi:predicted nuclease of predicted toxin-antitoxin system